MAATGDPRALLVLCVALADDAVEHAVALFRLSGERHDSLGPELVELPVDAARTVARPHGLDPRLPFEGFDALGVHHVAAARDNHWLRLGSPVARKAAVRARVSMLRGDPGERRGHGR